MTKFVIFQSMAGDPQSVITTPEDEKVVISMYKIHNVELMNTDDYSRSVYVATHIGIELPFVQVRLSIENKLGSNVNPVETNEDD